LALEIADHDMSEEQVAFREMVRRFFEEAAPIAEVRRVMEAGAQGVDAALWRRSAEELGLAGLAIAEEFGGQGFGLKELGIALAEAGRCLAPLPLFASAGLAAPTVAAVAGSEAGDWLGPIAEGRAATLGWVEAGGDWDPAAIEMVAEGQGDAVRLSGEKHFVVGAHGAERIFVVAREAGSHCDEGLSLFCVEAGGSGVRVEARESLDLTRPVSAVILRDAPARPVGPRGGAAAGLRAGLDEATALLCAEMAGGMQKVLEVAVDYAAERHQFSRPIGSFQAIKHKCANLLIDFEASKRLRTELSSPSMRPTRSDFCSRRSRRHNARRPFPEWRRRVARSRGASGIPGNTTPISISGARSPAEVYSVTNVPIMIG
jgi:alkylation response protein AidB-like acyl-CoA dehydrogenase